MRQVIPFNKDIKFKTKIDSITSISLEHSLKLNKDNLISGSFTVSGDYKITDNSLKQEEFNYNIPFDIVLDNSYKTDESTIDIDDFYYEIVDDDILRINIDVSIEGEIDEPLPIEESILNSFDEENESDELRDSYVFKSDDNIDIKKESENNMVEEIKDEIEEEKTESKSVESMFNAINNEEDETFSTYLVHIVKENETIESIIKKYNITKEMFLEYNKEDEIAVGNKLVIPSNNE